MKTITRIMSDTSLFGGLPDDQLKKIADIACERRFTKGAVIFSEGDEGDGFFIVAEGKVKIFKLSADGKEQTLHIFGPGEPFGEVPVFSGRSFPANAEAISETRLFFFPRSEFIRRITDNPSLALNMLAVLSMRLREFTVQIGHLSLKEVPERVAAYLLHLSDEQGKKNSVRLNISKGQLASLLGTVPETLSRAFAKLAAQNMILVDGRIIRLLDREGLEVRSQR